MTLRKNLFNKGDQPFLKFWSRWWIIVLILLTLIMIPWGFVCDFPIWWNGTVVALVFAMVIWAFALRFWYRYFEKEGLDEEKRKNPYRRMFFGSVNILSLILLAVGLTGAFLLLFTNDGRNHAYEAMGLVVIVIWSVIFLRYFLWAVYHFNINFGLTDKDWDNILDAREEYDRGAIVDKERLKAPKHNPYRSQTFGLPPGTVRGMIAFTLLFGAIAMLIVSMGMSGSIEQDSFYWDHFEFYKTAFLMMIAFYFGDRSLKYLQKRWPGAQQGDRLRQQAQQRSSDQPDDEIGEDDAEFRTEHDLEGDDVIATREVSPSAMKDILIDAESTEIVDKSNLDREFIHIRDEEDKKYLDEDTVANIADKVGTEGAVLRSIIAVESAGRGFLKDGRPKILFEGHKFWKWLNDHANIDPREYVSGNEDILYPSWTREHYIGGAGEYKRFQKAYNINKTAAVFSASWGLFQILGENFNGTNGVCKARVSAGKDDHYDVFETNPDDFIEKQGRSEVYHLLDFLEFIKNKKVKVGTSSVALLSLLNKSNAPNYNWDAFAYGYNGSGYKKHGYHEKMRKAYERFKNG